MVLLRKTPKARLVPNALPAAALDSSYAKFGPIHAEKCFHKLRKNRRDPPRSGCWADTHRGQVGPRGRLAGMQGDINIDFAV